MLARSVLLLVSLALFPITARAQSDSQLTQDFGEQLFVPKDGYLLEPGQRLANLVWEDPHWIAEHVGDTPIQTRWFNEQLREVTRASAPGRYYAYGEARGPTGSTLRRAITLVCADRNALAALSHSETPIATEDAALTLAAYLGAGHPVEEPRPGQWQMENATRHVALKRKLMGLGDRPPVVVRPRANTAAPAAQLRHGPLSEAGVTAEQIQQFEQRLDAWYTTAQQPTAIVVARRGVIVLEKAYGFVDNEPVTIDTPMLLHSAMKPLMGLQLAMYADRGHIALDEPLGKFLPDFADDSDRDLTFRAGHVHASGIHFPWPLAFSRLFYFRTWQDSMIAHRTRMWAPGEQHKYGVVGIILAVRALELLSGKNYWHAMESELFEPLGITNIQPGGTGFSAENLARIGVLLANGGTYGDQEYFSEETYKKILPTPLKAYFPKIEKTYGIGLQDYGASFGPGSYGHGGGCGTQLVVNPEQHLVFAMVRNERGDRYKETLAEVLAAIRAW